MELTKEQILDKYYINNAKELHKLVDKVLFKLKFDVDHDDFYSLANEIFVDVLKRYDSNRQNFDGFLYSCLMNKFKTEMTRRHREKRKADKMSISLDIKIGDDDSSTLSDVIKDNSDVENEVFNMTDEGYSHKMIKYLSKLSRIQKEILRLDIAGYSVKEIKEELNLTENEYINHRMAIRCYKNVSILF